MTLKCSTISNGIESLRARWFMILWISLVMFLFYDTFNYYKNGRPFVYLKKILGLGLCISRATATVLNLCGGFILLPQCKKLNQILYRLLAKLWPGLFFFWLKKTKTFHMTVATTLVTFGVLHSISHFVNLWNFSRGFDEECRDMNLANYKNENPLHLLLNMTCITGLLMLLTTLLMGITSLRVIRRRAYNTFWYSHQLYLPFMVLFLIHPLSGILKQEIIDINISVNSSQIYSYTSDNSTTKTPRFTAIESKTWLWMSVPLAFFLIDLLWRIFSRNREVIEILEIRHMAGRTISLELSCPQDFMACRPGQYVVLQCPQVSLLEWHPFTIVKIPNSSQRSFIVWIRVKGDWTEALEKILKEREPREINLLVDGPFSSPMEDISRNDVAICVAAGVGITPFVTVLHEMLQNPRSRLPGRIHLIWIVRQEYELTWLADLASQVINHLRSANRPDRFHLQLFVTSSANADLIEVVVNAKGKFTHVLNRRNDEKSTLLTAKLNICYKERDNEYIINDFDELAKDYPIVGCRVRQGRPLWDKVFGYWVHLYPGYHLKLFCCGPKNLVKTLRNKSKETSRNTSTTFTFIHEGFS